MNRCKRRVLWGGGGSAPLVTMITIGPAAVNDRVRYRRIFITVFIIGGLLKNRTMRQSVGASVGEPVGFLSVGVETETIVLLNIDRRF